MQPIQDRIKLQQQHYHGSLWVVDHLITHWKSTLPMLRLLSSKVQECKDILKNISTLSCWYSLDSSHRVLSDEYPYARVSVIFQVFASFCIAQIRHHQHKGCLTTEQEYKGDSYTQWWSIVPNALNYSYTCFRKKEG